MKKLKNIKLYEGGISSIPGKKQVIKVSSNESPFGPSLRVQKAISTAKSKTHKYPDGNSLELKNALSKKTKLNINNLFVGNGSDEILGLACQLFLNKGDEVIIPKHSFLMFEIYSKISGGVVKRSSTKNLRFDVKSILNKITKKTKIIFIAQPNNPTGFYLSKEELRLLISRVPKKIFIIIDSAYAEYVTDKDYSNGINFAKKYKNIIVTRTFSKIYGLAALRVGWCYAHTDIIKLMNKVRGPFNVNQIAQLAGVEALKDKKYEKNAINHNKFWLKKMNSELSRLPVNVYDSRANFLLINVGKSVKKLNQYLLSKSIIVRLMDKYNLPDCIRLSIGKSTENRKVLKAMKEFYNAK